MITLRSKLLFVIAVCLCRTALALLICGACGHELTEGQQFCGHCGAKAGDTQPPPATEAQIVPAHGNAAATAATDIPFQAFLDAAREDSRIAAEVEEAFPEVALCYYRNAAALSRLVPDSALPEHTAEKLIAAVERCSKRMSRAIKPCQVCSGTGRRTLIMQSLGDGSDGSQLLRGQGLACTACGGAGTVWAQRNADELRLLLAQGTRNYEVRQQAARRVAVGNAWAPGEEAATLTPRQQALLRTATAAPCVDCQGLGIQVCPGCKGQGRIPCKNRGCVNGTVAHKPANTLTPATALTIRTKCPACQGNSWTPCLGCGGSGHSVCRTCDGLGRPPKCLKCGGSGTAPCRACKGTGKDRAGNPCAACASEGIGLCTSCHGEGCAQR